MSRPKRPVSERFWMKVDKSAACWLWTASKTLHGYPRIDNTYAHRVSWEMAHGSIPAGMQVDHICHTRECVRPDHLRLATQKQNIENHAGPKKNCKSGVRGVYLHKQTGKWRPSVRHAGVVYRLGLFTDLAEAEAAVVAKRRELHSFNDRDRTEA